MPLDYKDKEVERLLRDLYVNGFTQAGVNDIYARLGLGAAPTVPASLAGKPLAQTRGGLRTRDGKPIPQEGFDFFNTFRAQAEDPYRRYGVGNYLGVAGMIVGGAGAGGAFSGAGAAGGGAAGGGSNLGIFANGGTAGMAGVGAGNAGALASSGAIAGGAGVGGTAAGAFGGFSRAANAVSGVGGNMSWMEWVPSLISAGTALVGGKKAGDATAAAAREATNEQRRQFDTVRADTAPQRALGAAAIDRLARYYGYGTESGQPDMGAFIESPDYQFNLAETQKAIDRSKAAQGGLLSGAAVREGQRYASNLASRENSAFLDRLMQQAGLGSTGIAQSAAAGANAANNIGGYAINAGNNRANIYQSTAANVNNSIQTGIGNAMLRRYLGG